MAGDQIRVNGNVHSWGSIIVKVGGFRFTGFTSINYGDKRERVKLWGMGRHHAPRGRSSGKYTPDPVQLGGPKSSFNALREALALLSPDQASYGNVEFEIAVQFIEFDELPMNVGIEGCVWSGDSSKHEESPDPLKDEAEFDCMRIRRNGKTLFDSTTGGP